MHPPIGRNLDLVNRLHIDGALFLGIIMLLIAGLFIVFSAGGENWDLLQRHGIRILISLFILLSIAQIPPHSLRRWSPHLFFLSMGSLVLVLWVGYVGRGAQSWLELGILRFQPSEVMKLAIPMVVVWVLTRRPLPPKLIDLIFAGIAILLPSFLVAMQPDLGTAILLIFSGLSVIFLAGVRWRYLLTMIAFVAAIAPYLWYQLHDHQRRRIVTMFNPWDDPMGSGYHIIQSQIAVGSAGIAGKGWLNGTQSQLEFIPERSTDFIFAVYAEEFGLIGAIVLIVLYLFVVGRAFVLAYKAEDSYTRLLVGSLALTFFFYIFVNTAMVTGVLPVVGIPLPLISYGGTSMVTVMAAFGVIMSASTHKRLMR